MLNFIKKYRCKLLTWSTHSLALPFIRGIMHLPPFPYSVADLQNMEAGSVGHLLLQFLHNHQLHLLPHYESHDIKHSLLSYPATEEGEASLQYFFFGNGQRSFPVLITVFITFFIMPEYHKAFRQAYSRGRATPPLAGTNWAAILPLPLSQVLQQLKIPSKQ